MTLISDETLRALIALHEEMMKNQISLLRQRLDYVEVVLIEIQKQFQAQLNRVADFMSVISVRIYEEKLKESKTEDES